MFNNIIDDINVNYDSLTGNVVDHRSLCLVSNPDLTTAKGCFIFQFGSRSTHLAY